MSMNQERFKSIGVKLMTLLASLRPIAMENQLMLLSMLVTFSKLKTSLGLEISLTILRKTSTHHTYVSLLVLDSLASMNGQLVLKVSDQNSVARQLDLKAQKKWFSLLVAQTSTKIPKRMLSIERLMETSLLVNREHETTSGSLLHRITYSAMQRKRCSMVQLWRFTTREPKSNSLRLLSLRRQLKIIKQLLVIYLVSQRTWAKVKLIVDPTSYTASVTCKELTHGMQDVASMVSPPKKNSGPTTT